ncbi:hypothetical protein EDD18DRAFT_1365240 [Armillaria luteobubalina]|uniref:Uncharacterized protein n=1 Tax=Armillaria luteobubalina TaxID=153913 RepID=A0AA39P531_9AGAR|nr:hypothetical protein EDD18DRAFT_1365240 [Armillaria luteobubalina]
MPPLSPSYPSPLIPSPPSPSIPSCQPSSMPVPAIVPSLAESGPDASPFSNTPPTLGLASASSILHPSSLIPADPNTVHSSLLPFNENSEDLSGSEFNAQLFWQDARFGQDIFSMGTTEHDRLAYDNLLGHVISDHEAESFPLLGTVFRDDDEAAENDNVDPGAPSKEYKYAQPEPATQLASKLPLLPSVDQDHINNEQASFSAGDDDNLTPVQMVNDKLLKQHHEAAEGSEGRLGEEGLGEEDHERKMSKQAQKPPASHAAVAAGWLPSAVQYLMDINLGAEWLDLLAAWQTLEALIS